MPAFDMTKPVRMRNGSAVELIKTNADLPSKPLVGIVTEDDGDKYLCCWTINGRYSPGTSIGHEMDLINAPRESRVFTNVYVGTSSVNLGTCYGTLYAAQVKGEDHSAGIVELIFEDDVLIDAKVHKNG